MTYTAWHIPSARNQQALPGTQPSLCYISVRPSPSNRNSPRQWTKLPPWSPVTNYLVCKSVTEAAAAGPSGAWRSSGIRAWAKLGDNKVPAMQSHDIRTCHAAIAQHSARSPRGDSWGVLGDFRSMWTFGEVRHCSNVGKSGKLRIPGELRENTGGAERKPNRRQDEVGVALVQIGRGAIGKKHVLLDVRDGRKRSIG